MKKAYMVYVPYGEFSEYQRWKSELPKKIQSSYEFYVSDNEIEVIEKIKELQKNGYIVKTEMVVK